MKTLITVSVLLLATLWGRPAHAQCTSAFTADVWMFYYSGDIKRGGVLSLYQSDGVGGFAYTSNGIPQPPLYYSPLPPCTWLTPYGREFGGSINLENLTPQCNGINYAIASIETSQRSFDGAMDHISQSGWAWGSNPGDNTKPAIVAQAEAGSLVGYPNPAIGGPNMYTNRTGYCNNTPF